MKRKKRHHSIGQGADKTPAHEHRHETLRKMFIDPTFDYGFKWLFGRPRNQHILLAFLNVVLKDHALPPITKVALMDKELIPDDIRGRSGVVDLHCEDQSGHKYIVEMQVAKEDHFEKRALFYATGLYRSQVRRADHMDRLRPTIFVALLNFNLFPDLPEAVNSHRMREIVSGRNTFGDLRFTTVELKKFTKTAEELETIEDQWLYIFTRLADHDLLPQQIVDETVREAAMILNEGTLSREERLAWERAWIGEVAYRSQMDTARREGLEEGKSLGIEEGKSLGIEEGKIVAQETILKTLLADPITSQLPDSELARLTGLSEDAVRTFRHT
jgi:predicted transposase/invertase (TIGR01784 family)